MCTGFKCMINNLNLINFRLLFLSCVPNEINRMYLWHVIHTYMLYAIDSEADMCYKLHSLISEHNFNEKF